MIIIAAISFVTAILVIWVISEQSSADRNMKHLFQNLMNNQLYFEEPQPFSLSAYFDRIEAVHIELLQEREQSPVSKVIELWWGLDGVKFLEDGTTEWVHKDATQILREITAPRDRECELQYRDWIDAQTQSIATTLYETAIKAQTNQYFPQPFCQQSCNLTSQIHQSIAQQTQAIESNIRTIQLQIAQQEQNERIMSNLAQCTNAYKGVPLFIDEMCNCCAPKSVKK